ncbi:hypothetical protein LG281_10810 [Pelagibacterium halotolerans]
MDKRYFETVQLLLDVAPLIFRGGDFAMKGGTAINLFHRDMPQRLLYNAITRAKRSCTVLVQAQELEEARPFTA